MSTMTERIPGVPISLGQSINVPVGSQLPPMRRHGRSSSESSGSSRGLSLKSRLPPAVANVPADHILGYVHTKRVNNYLVGNTLGEGSFAKVKEAFHIQVGEKVAMKVIDKKKAQQDPYVAKNFRREGKLLQMVRHPNILHLMEVIETDTSFYLITELCSGGELMKHIYSKGRLDEVETRKYMRQIVSAVDHLHRAGIIHRDLKVENMLLDENMDIKIIDFGLSNEEYVEGDNGMVHCRTQCGSPAYAAPELLGHKEYGPEVDIWSIGVNMYAMLTGCLPYTVEPFNITALHAKMLENKMNPIPESLSPECKSLLRQLLEANPERRIKMDAIMSHPWLNEGHALPFGPAPYPNSLTLNDINTDIIDHMSDVLKADQTAEELTQELLTNKATASACTYFLLSARLDRYKRKYPAKKTQKRHKSTRISQDHGFFEDVNNDRDDAMSIKSVPTGGITGGSRHGSRPSHVPLRERRGREGIRADRVTSHPPFSERPSLESPAEAEELTFGHSRRKSLPPAILENAVKPVHEKQLKKMNTWTHRSPHKPSGFTDYRPQDITVEDHDPPYELNFHDALGPVYPPARGEIPRNYSHGQQLNQIRKDLKDKLHPPPVQNAWRSQPGSRNTSRHGSRIPSSTSTRTSSIQSGLEEAFQDEEDAPIPFHKVKAHTLPRNFALRKLISQDSTQDDSTHLPSLPAAHHPPSTTQSRARSDMTTHRPNGLRTSSGDKYQVRTDHNIDEILTEVLRVAGNLKMRESEIHGHTLSCDWKGVKFKLTVHKDLYDLCHFVFKLISGKQSKYENLCETFVKKLKLE